MRSIDCFLLIITKLSATEGIRTPFPEYGGTKEAPSLLPSWILTKPNSSTFHRFFDSSPFSPSNRYFGELFFIDINYIIFTNNLQ